MNNPKDIYEWIELYLLGQLDKTELQKFEQKRKANKVFEEDICAIEIEMYEEGRLPIERKKEFEARLKNDDKLALDLALHKTTFEVIKYFDNKGCCKNKDVIFKELNSSKNHFQFKHPFLVYLQSKWQDLHNLCQNFTSNK